MFVYISISYSFLTPIIIRTTHITMRQFTCFSLAQTHAATARLAQSKQKVDESLRQYGGAVQVRCICSSCHCKDYIITSFVLLYSILKLSHAHNAQTQAAKKPSAPAPAQPVLLKVRFNSWLDCRNFPKLTECLLKTILVHPPPKLVLRRCGYDPRLSISSPHPQSFLSFTVLYVSV